MNTDSSTSNDSSSCGKTSLKTTLIDYFNLLKYNRNYRLYLFSHCMQHTGDWFIRIATLLSVERLAPDSATAISIIILCKIIPEVIVTSFGGVLSDSFDRRKLMISLDSFAALSTLSFIFAVRTGNVMYLFAATVLRSTIVSLYEPITKSIFPMFVTDPEDLKRAATLNGSAWAGMLLLGGICGGYLAAVIGIEACYVIDSLTYFLSAFIMSKVNGTFSVTQSFNPEVQGDLMKVDVKNKKLGAKVRSNLLYAAHGVIAYITMTKDFFVYLVSSGFGLCAFLKATGTLTWGTQDVLNASISFVEGNEQETARRMGLIYSSAGFGCLIGPFISNSFVVKGDKPSTLQLACIGAFLLQVAGWFGIAGAQDNFFAVCAFTVVRASGESIIWMCATLLLQTLTNATFLGRMLSFEYSVCRCTEAFISYLAGSLEDAGYGKHEIASLSACIGGMMFIFWSVYYLFGKGAANPRFNQTREQEIEVTAFKSTKEVV
mmetsp:Transcript_7369/g.11222  ORF Transcript_7369/g.11222 Transcript_7369/m.11222 type:complete len:489 (-) Transcript_7369:19-1485(-)